MNYLIGKFIFWFLFFTHIKKCDTRGVWDLHINYMQPITFVKCVTTKLDTRMRNLSHALFFSWFVSIFLIISYRCLLFTITAFLFVTAWFSALFCLGSNLLLVDRWFVILLRSWHLIIYVDDEQPGIISGHLGVRIQRHLSQKLPLG